MIEVTVIQYNETKTMRESWKFGVIEKGGVAVRFMLEGWKLQQLAPVTKEWNTYEEANDYSRSKPPLHGVTVPEHIIDEAILHFVKMMKEIEYVPRKAPVAEVEDATEANT